MLESGIYERLTLLYLLVQKLLSPFYYETQVREINKGDMRMFSYTLARNVELF